MNLKNNRIILLLLTLVALILWLTNLGTLALRDWDEGYYGTVAQDMFNHQEWLYPTYQGQPFWLKPPLLLWLMHLSYQLFGVNEWSSRLPSAVITALGVPLIYLLSQSLQNSQTGMGIASGKNENNSLNYDLTPLFSAAVYLTLLPVVRLGRLAMLDGMINTFFLVALLGLIRGSSSPPWLLLIGLGLGFIALSKGVLVIALGILLIGFILWERQFKILGNPWLWLGLFVGFLPALIWYSLQIQHYGSDFIKVHFLSQSLDRLNTVVEGNTGPIFFYLLQMLKYTAPWLFFFGAGVILQWRLLPQQQAKFNLGIGLGFLLIISLMQTKLPWYVMPFYIFFALITGNYLNYLISQAKTYPRLIACLLALCSVVGAGGWIYFTFFAFQFPLIILTSILTLTLGITTFFFFKSDQRAFLSLIPGLYLTLLLLMLSPVWNWELNEAFAVKPVGALIKTQTPPQTLIYTSFAYSRPSLDFYSDRQVLAVDEQKLRELAGQSSYLLLQPEILNKLALTPYAILGNAEGFILIKTQPKN